MGATYQNILHDVAIRLNALVGTQVATIAASYDAVTLTAANFKSADWPFGSVRDAILMAEEDFAWAIADTANHPWRSGFLSVTDNLIDTADVPAVNISGRRIIGALGAVYDSASDEECLEGELDEIARVRRLLASGALTLPVYLYRIDGQRIRHTVTSVVIEVCFYSRIDQLAAFNINAATFLPDVLELAVTARALAILTKETAFADQAATYAKYADDALSRIRAGLTSVAPKAVPISAGGSA